MPVYIGHPAIPAMQAMLYPDQHRVLESERQQKDCSWTVCRGGTRAPAAPSVPVSEGSTDATCRFTPGMARCFCVLEPVFRHSVVSAALVDLIRWFSFGTATVPVQLQVRVSPVIRAPTGLPADHQLVVGTAE